MAKRKKRWTDPKTWIPIIVAIISAAALIYASQSDRASPTPSTSQYSYFGHVVDGRTKEPVDGGKVTLEYQGAPQSDHTDSNGYFRFTIVFAGSGLDGRLRVTADGYRVHDQIVDLPAVDTNFGEIRLEPADAPVSSAGQGGGPTCEPCRRSRDADAITCLIEAEGQAVLDEDLTIIRSIFADGATVRDAGSGKQWDDPVMHYAQVFATVNYTDVVHFDIQSVDPEITGDVAYFTSGSRGSYLTVATPPASHHFENEAGSDHWTFRKDGDRCWVIADFTFNGLHVPFPP